MVFLTLILAFLTVVTLVLGLSMRPEAASIRNRVASWAAAAAAPRGVSALEQELQLPFSDRMIRPMLRALARLIIRLTPNGAAEATQARLNSAGNPGRIGVREFFGLRVISIFGFSALGLVMFQLLIEDSLLKAGASLGLTVLIGLTLPDYMLQQSINTRQYRIRKSLPDILDLLIVSVEAGLGFDGAMAKVVEKVRGPFPDELRRVLEEMRLGKSRMDALRAMSDRVSVSEVSTFVAAIYQADQLGVSIAKVLHVQSDTMRVARSQRIRELAAKLPVKMLFPLVFFIFPAIFVVVIGAGVIVITQTFIMQ
jgi:tight adherence protein C